MRLFAYDGGMASDLSASRARRLTIAISLNVVIVVAQVVFGIVAGSIGLISDAGHNLTDVAALALSLIAVQVARRAPTAHRSFGWHRGTILAAQANAAMILVLTVWIAYESIQRLIDPPEVEGGLVLVVALVAFVVNAGSALIVREGHAHGGHEGHHHPTGGDLNMRSATLHLVSDAAASLGVAVAGGIMLATGGWSRLDPAVSLLIGLSIAWQAVGLLRSSNAVLLEGTPEGLDLDRLQAAVEEVPGVDAIHDVHVWSLSSELTALSAHVVVEGHPTLEEAQAVAGLVRRTLATSFGIGHATIELECESCEDHGPVCDIDALDLHGVVH
jgi:cobalt-zinc-cadmium efflux system protein